MGTCASSESAKAEIERQKSMTRRRSTRSGSIATAASFISSAHVVHGANVSHGNKEVSKQMFFEIKGIRSKEMARLIEQEKDYKVIMDKINKGNECDMDTVKRLIAVGADLSYHKNGNNSLHEAIFIGRVLQLRTGTLCTCFLCSSHKKKSSYVVCLF